jgi:hypothetical protein
VILVAFEHTRPVPAPINGGSGMFRAHDGPHEFQLKLLVLGAENAAAVELMLRRWLGDVGAAAPRSAPPLLGAGS